MSKEAERLAAEKKAAELKEKQEADQKVKDATALAEKEQADRIEALRLEGQKEAERLAAEKSQPTQPTLLDGPVNPELIAGGDMVTIENASGVQHTVSATVAKVLAGDATIKVVKNG